MSAPSSPATLRKNSDGSLTGPFGKVGADVALEQAHEVARKVGLSILGSLQREFGDLDRIAGWCSSSVW